MNLLKNPGWLSRFEYTYPNYEALPQSVFDDINARLAALPQGDPLISIIIPAWNEEVSILRSIASLAAADTKFPFEIIVVNNNSKDHTGDTLRRLHIRSFDQPVQGCGPARQKGQENARGKYVLLADADCIYPASWIDEMMKVLQQPGVVCVYGRYSFIARPGFPRWKLALLEKFKDLMTEIRHVNRPFLSAYGMSFGYVKEYGLKVGFVDKNIRGEDGKMCYDLMPFGKVKQVRSRRARIWTGTRTLEQDGGFWKVFGNRIVKEARRFSIYFNTRMDS